MSLFGVVGSCPLFSSPRVRCIENSSLREALSWQSACQRLQQSAWMAMTGRQAGLVLVQSVLQHMHVVRWDAAERLELTGWAALQPCCF